MIDAERTHQMLVFFRMGLKKQRYAELLRMCKEWLECARPGEVEELIAACAPAVRPQLLAMLHDLLAHFPRAIFGMPVLFKHCWTTPIEADLYLEETIPLPTDSVATREPLSGLSFIGWAAPSSPWTTTGKRPKLDDLALPPGGAKGAVMLFKSSDEHLIYNERPSTDDNEQWLQLPDIWYARLLGGLPGNLLMQPYRLMPYPEAVEAARVMCATAGVQSFNTDHLRFIGQEDIEKAKDKARNFVQLSGEL